MKQVKDYLREYLDAVRVYEDIISTPCDCWDDNDRVDAAEALALAKLAYDEAMTHAAKCDYVPCEGHRGNHICPHDTLAPAANGWGYQVAVGWRCPECHKHHTEE